MTGIKTIANRKVYNYLKFKREIFVIKDGTEIAIDSNIDQSEDRPLLIIVPGLLSNFLDHYHHTLIEEASSKGDFDWTLINYRGVTHPLNTPIPFSTSEFVSFRESLDYLLQKHKNRKIVMVGSSLGGNVIANILPEYDDGRIKAVALVTPALDM
jgi:predicted alpha/beta-fold hydrolase